MKKRLLAILLAAIMIFSLMPTMAFTESDTPSGPVITAEKTATWTNKDKTTAEIDIQVKCDDSNSKPKDVLLLGTLCTTHGMASNTLKTTINTVAAKMNVQYYGFAATKQSSTNVKSGYLKKGEKLGSGFSFDADSGRHYAGKQFIETLYTELVTNEKSYDYLFFEFDSTRIALNMDDLAKQTKTDLTDKMDALAPILSDYYTNHKVIWVTDKKGRYSNNISFAFFDGPPSNITQNYTSDPEFKLEKFEFKVITCLMSPTEYAGFDTKYSDYSTSKKYTLNDIDSYASDISYASKMNYDEIDELSAFIKKRMLSQRNNITISDTVVSDMEITSAKVQTSADAITWADYKIDSPSSLTVSEDKKSVNVTIKDFLFEIGTIEYVRLVISVKDTGRFKVTTAENQYSRDPNSGKASITVSPVGYTNTSLTPSTKEPLKWEAPIYTLKTNVKGGTTPDAKFYAAKGESPISETAPLDDTYSLIYAKVNGTALSGTALENYKSTHKYTVSSITKDTVIDVCYGKPADGTYIPVKENETPKEPVTDKMLTNTNIKVVLDGGKWTKPANLTATETAGIYTIDGDYNMGTASKSGNVFLGWKVTDGEGDIVKIYEAIFEADETGKDPDSDGPDGIPDKYQRKITFKVENGTWDGTSNNDKDKKQYVTLKDGNGKWSVDGSANVTAPSGMVANYGYENGKWATSNPAVTSGSKLTITKSTDTTFTHSFSKIADKDVTFKKPNNQIPAKTKIPYGKKIKIDPNGGSVTVGTKKTAAFEKVIEADFTIPDATPMEGYKFTGWAETDGTGDVKKVYTAQYEALPVTSKYQPVKTNEDTPEDVTDKTVKFDDKVKVILNGGNWSKPEKLSATTTSGIYTVKGDYNMGTASKNGNVFLGWKVTDGEGDIVKIYEAIFEADETGKDPDSDGPDGIPDKYQRKITFKVENGTWDGTSNNDKDKKQYVTLKDGSGNWSVDGSAKVTAPSGMVANYGYENGKWATSNPTVTSGSKITVTKSTDTTFTHAFTPIPDKDVTFKKPDGEEPVSSKIPYGRKIKIDPNGGSVTVGTKQTAPFEKVIEADFTIPDATPMEGYKFTGWAETDGTGDVKKVYTAQYEALPVTSKYQPVQTNEKKPDDIIDNTVKFDDKVKVVLDGGTWSKPEKLVATATPGIYTVKGDYSMGIPSKEGYIFLGWDVTEGKDGTSKVYTAKYVLIPQEISPKTGYTVNISLLIMMLALSTFGLFTCIVLGKKKKIER